MKKIFINVSFAAVLLAMGCSRDRYAELNTDPSQVGVTVVLPEMLFPNAPLALHTNDFEAYYDFNRNIEYWIGAWVPLGGNSGIITRFRTPTTASSYPYRYDNLYFRETTGAGGAMLGLREVIDKMPAGERAKHLHMRAISYVPMAYGAFNLSDAIGSVAYTQGMRARYTDPPLLKPKFDTQEALYDTLENELKAAVAVLSAPPSVEQKKLGTYDLYFRGTGNESLNWAQAANSLRLRIAMRMLKRKPQAAAAIINSVLTDAVGPINSRASNWVFKGGENVGNGGNYNLAAALSGQKASIDFQYKTTDPRMRIMYQKVALTEAQFNTFKANGTIAASEVYQTYRGRPTSPDAQNNPATRFYFNYITGTTAYVSYMQQALFNRAVGLGFLNYPVITYAEVCFMRAELAARGITAENAAEWYYKGIDASCADYDQWGKDANVAEYVALSTAEVTAYKNHPDIVYNPAKGVEQIAIQQFFHHWKNPSELWANIRRTGYPSPTGVVFQAERIMNNGVEQVMPRRWSLFMPPITDLNYENRKAAIEEMQKDPELGDLTDITGRVWWDKK
ncbi:SusD/RagB family nutrient-binding outer membrane lipoprotein [Chitinophaga horti]|uniref:SusD/RagB family nutrient-binding outer membrane lipoprotein n=1 Tax=Chitinophaga horti TaxID=2920382 RepID=A0ABY6J705_9BACT|nr:SusD/RagB family nutrient-binding outer membrane lipoprotein [Chitinophaga horti]UYQ95451.1 SusD/RagB family nutrient-binding outer membrane lipoprotein [Chitinophaga horti]